MKTLNSLGHTLELSQLIAVILGRSADCISSTILEYYYPTLKIVVLLKRKKIQLVDILGADGGYPLNEVQLLSLEGLAIRFNLKLEYLYQD